MWPALRYCRGMKRALLVLVLLVIVAMAVAKLLIFELPRVAGTDMAPSLQPGDLLLANRLKTEPARGQLVLIQHPEVPNRVLIRRVIGLPGERVAVIKETPRINGRPATRKVIGDVALREAGEKDRTMKLVEETHGEQQLQLLKDPRRRSVDAKEIALGQAYYVMSDNRNHGTDSRTFGPVPAAGIRGVITHRLAAGPGCIAGQAPREGWQALKP